MPTEQYIKLDVDMKATKAALSSLEKTQFPFAYAKSLTETAEAARQGVGIQSRRVFDLHTEFIPKNIKKSGASKQDIQHFGFGEASVFTGKRLDDWMGLHEFGGTKEPSMTGGGKDTGRSLALPGKELKQKSYKTRSGRVKARFRPKRLLAGYTSSRGGRTQTVRRGGRKKTPFIIEGQRSGVPMIVRRTSKKRYPLEVLYIFRKEAKIDDTWKFGDTVKRVANFAFRKKFARNLKNAIDTAR